MPFSRPTLTELRNAVDADIVAGMPDGEALLRHSNVRVLGAAQAGLGHLHYGYLDWISRQSVPWTATDEYLEAWGSLKSTYRKPAAFAEGEVAFPAVPGSILSEGSSVVSGSGALYLTTAGGIATDGGVLTVTAKAVLPGTSGNCASGTVMMLQVAVPGVTAKGSAASAFTFGVETEEAEEFRSRVMLAFQQPPRGGSENDYVTWAREVPGVTRAWCARNGYGAGTVVVYVMFDVSHRDTGGFPVGADGVASLEDRHAITATGDQLAVANTLYDLQPVTALVLVCAPRRNWLTLTVTGLATASVATRAAIAAAVSGVLALSGSPLRGTVNRTDLVTAISAVPQTAGFVLTAVSGNEDGVETIYVGNISSRTGYLPTLDAVNYPG